MFILGFKNPWYTVNKSYKDLAISGMGVSKKSEVVK